MLKLDVADIADAVCNYIHIIDGEQIYEQREFHEWLNSLIIKEENMEKTTEPAEPIMQYFAYEHLPAHLQAISKPFGDLATEMLNLPRNPERYAGLRKLLAAKDCMVRARLSK